MFLVPILTKVVATFFRHFSGGKGDSSLPALQLPTKAHQDSGAWLSGNKTCRFQPRHSCSHSGPIYFSNQKKWKTIGSCFRVLSFVKIGKMAMRKADRTWADKRCKMWQIQNLLQLQREQTCPTQRWYLSLAAFVWKLYQLWIKCLIVGPIGPIFCSQVSPGWLPGVSR